MIKLSEFKKNSSSLFDDLKRTTEDFNKKTKTYDDSENATYWKPSVDKTGNGGATIRFLPALPGDDSIIRYWSHSVKVGSDKAAKYYIENCPTTLGNDHKCPVCEHNKMLWDSGDDKDKALASARKRKLNFVSNIYVITDKLNPDNEGKVFRFRYGKKIFDMLDTKMHPPVNEFNPKLTKKPVNPFDPWKGATFFLNITKQGDFWNYDTSEFDSQEGPFLDDKELEAVLNQVYLLKPLIAPERFGSYEELLPKFNRVIGSTGPSKSAAEVVSAASKRPTVTKETVVDEADDVEALIAKLKSEED